MGRTQKELSNLPQIIPIKDLKNTSEISEMCRKSDEPVFITKNGYGDMVIMSMETYEKTNYMSMVCRKLAEAEASFAAGRGIPAETVFKNIRKNLKESA